MDVEKTGGAAFPGAFTRLNNYNEVVERSFQNGMTLRDYFAAKALQGALAEATAKREQPISCNCQMQPKGCDFGAMVEVAGEAGRDVYDGVSNSAKQHKPHNG